ATEGAVARAALDSLAMRFRQVLEMCRDITGKPIDTIHIVGGGTRNTLLCQLAADATNCRVVAGPVEATAIGNIMMQAVAAGDVAGIQEARSVIRDSFDVVEYLPNHTEETENAYHRFLAVCDK
ncbi:MAG: FGGY-family carbohydrate kinase, partial [Planctomycetia bacterium]|nr:FGGY-family carbohydrate kinase [Planctomycetia bacterium]